jgi:hypothetical protein
MPTLAWACWGDWRENMATRAWPWHPRLVPSHLPRRSFSKGWWHPRSDHPGHPPITLTFHSACNELHALLGCSVLAEDAIRSAIDDWKEKHGLPVEHREPVAEHDH